MPNIIKRLPTIEEANEKSYRDFYYKCLGFQHSEKIQIVPPHIVTNPDILDYNIFEFTLDEMREAYLKELEEKLEAIKKRAESMHPSFNYKDATQQLAITYLDLQNYLSHERT